MDRRQLLALGGAAALAPAASLASPADWSVTWYPGTRQQAPGVTGVVETYIKQIQAQGSVRFLSPFGNAWMNSTKTGRLWFAEYAPLINPQITISRIGLWNFLDSKWEDGLHGLAVHISDGEVRLPAVVVKRFKDAFGMRCPVVEDDETLTAIKRRA